MPWHAKCFSFFLFCRKHTVHIFPISLTSLHLFAGIFSPFTFNIIIGRVFSFLNVLDVAFLDCWYFFSFFCISFGSLLISCVRHGWFFSDSSLLYFFMCSLHLWPFAFPWVFLEKLKFSYGDRWLLAVR